LHALLQCDLEIDGVVTDDRDTCGLEPESQCLLGEERAVQIGSLAPNELAARDDDGDARPDQELRGTVSWPLFGTLTLTPATRITTFLGEESVIVSFCGANRFTCPRSSVPR
jgi:hypothetical protein